MRLGDAPAIWDVEAVSTGSLGLDIALGIGGLPRGRVVEVFGPESSGKTTLTLQVVAEVQRAGGTAAFVDAEHALDPSYAEKLGVNIGDLLVSQPDTGEQALEITDMLVRSGAVDLVVIDSVAALTPKAEIEGEMGEMQVGLHARLMSQALRKLTGNIKRSNTMVIFINQIRMKIGVMFGSPETTTGGNALKFYASVRLDIRRIGAIKNGEEVVGNMTRVKVVKNKVSPPFREAEFEIMYGVGISREGEIIELGSQQGIIDKSGAWYSYKGERIGQGKDNVRTFLQQHPEIAREIEEQVRLKLLPAKQGSRASGDQAEHGLIRAASARRYDDAAPRRVRPAPPHRIPTAPAWRRWRCWPAVTSPVANWRTGWSGMVIPAEAVAAVLADLTAAQILDDTRFAAQYVAYHAQRGQGPRRIAMDLDNRGVAQPLIEAALAGGPDWAALAREVRSRRFGPTPPKSWAEKAKQGRFLQYRGFSSDHVRSALGPDFESEDPP